MMEGEKPIFPESTIKDEEDQQWVLKDMLQVLTRFNETVSIEDVLEDKTAGIVIKRVSLNLHSDGFQKTYYAIQERAENGGFKLRLLDAPPSLAERLKLFVATVRNMLGDLTEEFHEKVKEDSRTTAHFWYYKQILSSIVAISWNLFLKGRKPA